MKRISMAVALAVLLAAPLVARAQDAGTEERLNKLQAALETVQASNVDLQKRMTDLSRELQELRTQAAKPSGDYAAADDVKKLAEAIKEVDRKRQEDRDLILDELKKLGRTVTETSRSRPADNVTSHAAEKGYEYVVQSGDTISSIVKAYNNQGVKIGVDDVLKANPGVNPSTMAVGTKLFIPAK